MFSFDTAYIHRIFIWFFLPSHKSLYIHTIYSRPWLHILSCVCRITFLFGKQKCLFLVFRLSNFQIFLLTVFFFLWLIQLNDTPIDLETKMDRHWSRFVADKCASRNGNDAIHSFRRVTISYFPCRFSWCNNPHLILNDKFLILTQDER